MSYQSSIYFDPTALLIIKNEIDSSITHVETTVSALVEDQELPFGIDDALVRLEQCSHVLALIGVPDVAKVTQYATELMHKILSQPKNINIKEIEVLSEATSTVKRYVEFMCLKEVKATDFLLETLNNLEIVLKKIITPEGYQVAPFVEGLIPDFDLDTATEQPKSVFIHQLYKLCLHNVLAKKSTLLDYEAIKVVGAHLSYFASQQPSKQYWNLVHYVFNQLSQLTLDPPRLRSLIEIEQNIRQYLEAPERFKANLQSLTNIISLAIRQENSVSLHIREQLNIQDQVLSQTQLKVLNKHLYAPDLATIHAISELMTTQMADIRIDIEYNYQTMDAEKIQILQGKIQDTAHIFHILNMESVAVDLTTQAQALHNTDQLKDENFAQDLMNHLLIAMNAIGILERRHTSNRLQHQLNNEHIALDRLDEAYDVLLNEMKLSIESINQLLNEHLQTPDTTTLETLPAKFNELSGALLFLNVKKAQQALKHAAHFLQTQLDAKKTVELEQINYLFDTLAGADMLIDNMKNNQPVLNGMFDIALNSSLQLKAIA